MPRKASTCGKLEKPLENLKDVLVLGEKNVYEYSLKENIV